MSSQPNWWSEDLEPERAAAAWEMEDFVLENPGNAFARHIVKLDLDHALYLWTERRAAVAQAEWRPDSDPSLADWRVR
jgi:hypothetical protein